MIVSSPRFTVIAAMLLTVSLIPLMVPDEAEALPPNYPIWLSGGYAVEQPNSTTYVDNLQPGSTENYLIHLINDREQQIRYRVILREAPDDWLVFLGSTGDEVLVTVEGLSSRAVDLNMKAPTEKTGDIDILVREEGTENEWDLTLRIISQKGPLVVSVPSANMALGRDSPSVFDLSLENIGNTVLNASLKMEGMITSNKRIRDSWTVIFSEKETSIQPGRIKTVEVTVWPPELEPVGSQKVTSVTADVDGITRPFKSRSITFKVQTIYDLRVSVMPLGYQLISPGESVEFVVTLENWAIDYDTVSISEFEKPSGWDVQFNDSMDPTSVPVTIDPEGERIIHPVIFTPNNAVAGNHEVILRAQGTTNLTEIRLKVKIARQDSFELTTITESGSDNTYRMTVGENLIPVKVVNRGNFFDNITMEIESRPDWAPLSLHSLSVGSGSNETSVQGALGLNISGQFNRRYLFQEDPLTSLSVTFDPSQTATLYLRANIPLGATQDSGVFTLKYRYGIFQEQKVLQAAIKLILVDIEILDIDGDGGADLDVHPEPEYEVGDTINFIWTLKNNYPYETTGLRWSVELSGKTLIEGDVPPIAPGETMDFNESWKADLSTRYYNVATLKITGDVFTTEDKIPTARTDEEIYIDPGPGEPPILLMVVFGSIMLIIIAGFVAFYIWVRKDLEKKEAVEREKYESLYGKREAPALAGRKETGRRRAARSLSARERPGLPSSRVEEGEKKEKGSPSGKGSEPAGKMDRKAPRKKASSLGDLGGNGSSADKKRSKPEKMKKAPELEELEELEDA